MRDGREVVTDRYDPGLLYNVYDCPGQSHVKGEPLTTRVPHTLLSADVDMGTTPMLVTCPDHGETAGSRVYSVDVARQPSLFPVRMVWRRPTSGERKRERREGGDHYARGGLAREWVR